MQGLVGLKSYTYIEKHWPFLSQNVNLISNIYNLHWNTIKLKKCIDTINDFFYLLSFIEFEWQKINYDFEAEG